MARKPVLFKVRPLTSHRKPKSSARNRHPGVPREPNIRKRARPGTTERLQWTPANMQRALDALDAVFPGTPVGERGSALKSFIGLKAIALENKVPRCTLRRRWLLGITNPSPMAGHQPVMTSVQEKELSDLIIDRQSCGFPISIDAARLLVFRFCEQNSIKHPFNCRKQRAGWNWWCGFRKRHPEISLRKPENLSLSRALGMERNRVGEFYNQLSQQLEKYGIKNNAKYLYNVDETGVQTVTTGGKILARKGSKLVQTITSAERGSNTTIVVAGNAKGDIIPPFVIFKGLRILEGHKEGFPPGTQVSCSKSGWVDKELFLRWFEHFVASLPPRPVGQFVGLFMDGHASHNSPELFLVAKKHNIVLIGLPSHTSNFLQPLDVSVFGPFKRSWSQRCCRFMTENPGTVITRFNFGSIFTRAYNQTITGENLVAGFRRTGLCPFNSAAIPDQAFRASEAILAEPILLPAVEAAPFIRADEISNLSTQQLPPSNGIGHRLDRNPHQIPEDANVMEAGGEHHLEHHLENQILAAMPDFEAAGAIDHLSFECATDRHDFADSDNVGDAVFDDCEINLRTPSANSPEDAWLQSPTYSPNYDSMDQFGSTGVGATTRAATPHNGPRFNIQSRGNKSYTCLKNVNQPPNSDSENSPEMNVSFNHLVVPINENRDKAKNTLGRMRPVKTIMNSFSPVKQPKGSNMPSTSSANNKKSPNKRKKKEFPCVVCEIDYYKETSDEDWLYCMECRACVHETCGISTKGVFFCKPCVPGILGKLNV